MALQEWVELPMGGGKSWVVKFKTDRTGMKFVLGDLDDGEKLVFLPGSKMLMAIGPDGATGVWFDVTDLEQVDA